MSTIKESFILTGSNTDIMAAPSRLAAIPGNGILTIEMSTTDSDATNFGVMTLQLPDGEVPFEDLIIPANGYGVDNILHSETSVNVQVPVAQGGHVSLAYTETGTVALTIVYLTLTF